MLLEGVYCVFITGNGNLQHADLHLALGFDQVLFANLIEHESLVIYKMYVYVPRYHGKWF